MAINFYVHLIGYGLLYANFTELNLYSFFNRNVKENSCTLRPIDSNY